MVVDDELDIVVIFKQALHKYGFTVFGFTDPILALEHFKSNAGNYVLVISDIRMPQMNGFEFATNVKAIKPGVKILLMSAFEVNDLEFSKSTVTANNFLRKPVDIKTLLQKVRTAIAE